MNNNFHVRHYFKKLLSTKALVSMTIIAFMVFGAIYILKSWNYYKQHAEEQAIGLAASAEAFIPAELVSKLEVNLKDIEKIEYNKLKDSLIKFKERNKGVRFAYLYTQIDGEIYFMVDSETPDSDGYSPPGQLYPEATPQDFQPFIDGKTIMTAPVTDRWGTWVSVLVPVMDPATGKVIAVLGADYPAAQWRQDAVDHVLYITGVILSFVLLLVAIYWVLIKNEAQDKMLRRQKILVDVLNKSFSSRQEQLDYVLHESLELTESRHGYIYMYDEEAREFTLNSWTRDVMAECTVTDKKTKYQLEKTGIWGEVVRQRKAIVVNNFQQPNPLKKGYPAGHVELKRFMSAPVIIDGKIVAVVGLANKESNYNDNDVYEMTLLMNGIWNAVTRREAQEKLSFERNKYLQTLISIGDGVLVVDRDGKIEMLNKVAQKLTGWTFQEAQGEHYKDVFVLSHEKEGFFIDDPIEGVLATDMVQELGNHAILTSRDGTKYNLEDSAAPIKNETNTTVGVVLVFRDVTDKIEQRKKIEYLSFHDSLTGLYNRRFFEEELCRLDTERNLPLSIIMGDVNGLKLTNDIFGHTYGDLLLEKVSETLQKVCRADDIIARWGGDEFVILLPRTSLDETKNIVERIKSAFANEQIKAIKGSISMGFDTKHDATEDIMQVLFSAEEKMYAAKTLERDEIRRSVIDVIIKTLHEKTPWIKGHSVRVSELCMELGKALELPEVELRKLKEAGYLHDIGKIVLEPQLLNKPYPLTTREWNEMQKHPVAGYRILHSFDDTVDLAEPVLAHHEHWDGHGYPKGLKGEEIPLLARIITVVESYDRMVHYPSNTAALSHADALKVLRKNAGKRFNPVIAELFALMMEAKALKEQDTNYPYEK